MTNKFKASPLSNAIICDYAKQFRKMLGIKDNTPIDILSVLEIAMPLLDGEFNYSVRHREDMEVDTHAYTDPSNNEIVILNEIYDRAVAGHGRDRFTIAHELGHYLLHNRQMCVLTRIYGSEKILPYEDPEWQADAFAGEFLCPVTATTGISVKRLSEKYGVSMDAARSQKRKGGSFDG